MTYTADKERLSYVIKGVQSGNPSNQTTCPGRNPAKGENSVFPCGWDGPKRSILVARHRQASSMGAPKQGSLREKSASFWMCLIIREQTTGRSPLHASVFDAEAYKTFKQLTGARKWRLVWFFFGRDSENTTSAVSTHASRVSGLFLWSVLITSCLSRKSAGIEVENRAGNCLWRLFRVPPLWISHVGLSLRFEGCKVAVLNTFP